MKFSFFQIWIKFSFFQIWMKTFLFSANSAKSYFTSTGKISLTTTNFPWYLTVYYCNVHRSQKQRPVANHPEMISVYRQLNPVLFEWQPNHSWPQTRHTLHHAIRPFQMTIAWVEAYLVLSILWLPPNFQFQRVCFHSDEKNKKIQWIRQLWRKIRVFVEYKSLTRSHSSHSSIFARSSGA